MTDVRRRAVVVVTLLSLSLVPIGCNKPTIAKQGTGVKCGSIEQFLDYWTRAYDNGNNKALLNLIFSEGIPKSLIDEYSGLFTAYAGKHRVSKTEFAPYTGKVRPYDWNGKEVLSPIRPKWLVTINTEGNEGFEGQKSTYTVRFAVGETDDGRFGIPFGDYGIQRGSTDRAE